MSLIDHLQKAGALWCLCFACLFGAGAATATTTPIARHTTALALAEQGAHAQALPIIEDLVSEYPANKLYRFQLALILFELGRDVRATFHLEQLRGTNLNAQERGIVTQALNRIAERKVWGAYFSFNIKPESNGIKQTETRNLVVSGIPVTLRDTALGKPTVSAEITTGFSYTPNIAPGLKAQFSLNAYLKHNDDAALRDHQLTARAGLLTQNPDGTFWAAGLLAGARRVADAPYSQTLGAYGNHARNIGHSGRLQFGLEVSRAALREGRTDQGRFFVTGIYTHALSGRAQFSFGGFIERNLNDTKSLDGTRLGMSITGLYAFKGGLITGVTLRGEMDDRNGVNPAFRVARSDRKLALDVNVYHRDFRVGIFAPTIKFGIERNRSNVALADYTNRYVSFGLTRNF